MLIVMNVEKQNLLAPLQYCPKEGGILALGGKIQGKSAATVQKACHPLSFDGFRLCNDIYKYRSFSILPLQKESSCLGENCRAKRWC